MEESKYTKREISINEWKSYPEIWTHALWTGNYRLDFLKDCGDRKFHGNFIPEIPFQMMMRYTKKNDYVLDPMVGSGTTGDVAKMLERNCDMFDLNPLRKDIVEVDASIYKFANKKYDLIMWHPPYFNIIQFSKKENDLSNKKTLEEFLKESETVVFNLDQSAKDSSTIVVVCGEIYKNKEEIPLGFYITEMFKKIGWKRKAVIIKDYGETKGGNVTNPKNKNLQRYRHLKNGTWNFCGDFIFILKK